ncbi:unnamed protein product [Parascedosporium putredinis]|uniref:Extracellular serine-rich protein n=1 Tax=Parascedosporium putredinis TaxID=1442378 RepID=A0A9P1H027_9PEZI|nr:unnamed protein product [Parascedosporium putredinis]CAI7992371.1 unnamed protein product [Parascedosporium putredinis]
MRLRQLFPGAALLALQAALASALSTSSTVLIFARDEDSGKSGSYGLRGYGIPYEIVIGIYGGFIVLSEVGYDYENQWRSALTDEQWQVLYDYQGQFGVRMVRLDVFPSAAFGTKTQHPVGGGCCEEGQDQLVSITNSTAFPTANLKTDQAVSLQGIWHYPAIITDDSIAWEVAGFGPAGEFFEEPSTAAIINRIDNHEQMVFFMGWATDWALVSNYLQHAYIHWMTRGLSITNTLFFLLRAVSGNRKTYLSTQVDDVHLDTPLFQVDGEGPEFRIITDDLDAHKTWQAGLNTRLPAGSDYFMEMCHNGNGDIIVATDDDFGWEICDPNEAIDYESPPDTDLEFMKPLGTGTSLWPPTLFEYPWSLECCQVDPLASWFMVPENRDAYAHVSHTFTHLELNNATYDDAWREIAFNREWLNQVGIANGLRFSPSGIVPPAITGLHNGDVIRAWLDNDIRHVVGDNTRPALRNKDSTFWPKISNEEDNGFPGLVIIPRWATNIYYNCASPECTVNQWKHTTTIGDDVTFEDLIHNEVRTNVRYLLGLQHDPYMFHQANMHQSGVEEVTIGDQSGTFSLLQIWVEHVTQEFTRLTNWPVLTLKHDDIAQLFVDRMARDQCTPNLSYNYSEDGLFITSVTVTTTDNTCDVPVPVTFPGSVESTDGVGSEDKVGDEPLIVWVTMEGSPVTFTLAEPVSLW